MSSRMRRRIEHFRQDPWGSVARRAGYEWFCWRARRFWARQPWMRDFLTARPAEAFPPDYADLWFLYRTVRRRRPRLVLEFGSGCSTLALALALHENRGEGGPAGRLVSIDSDPYWTESTRGALPEGSREYCEILHRPAVETEWNGTPVFRHSDLPQLEPDLVYLDGPPLTPERKVAVDVLDLEDRFRPGFLLIVDGRWANAMFLREHLRGEYRFEYRTLFQNSTFETMNDE